MTVVTIGDNTADDFSGSEDTQITENTPTTNAGGNADYEIRNYDTGLYSHVCIRFGGLSNITPPVTVSDATLFIYYKQAGTSGPNTISAFKLLRDWVEGQATWNVYSTGNNWGTAGGTNTSSDITAGAVASVGGIEGSMSEQYFGLTGAGLVSLVEDWINGDVTNNGCLLRRTDGQNDLAFTQWYSSEGTDGKRPYLEVTYEAAGGGGGSTVLVPALAQRNRRKTGRFF